MRQQQVCYSQKLSRISDRKLTNSREDNNHDCKLEANLQELVTSDGSKCSTSTTMIRLNLNEHKAPSTGPKPPSVMLKSSSKSSRSSRSYPKSARIWSPLVQPILIIILILNTSLAVNSLGQTKPSAQHQAQEKQLIASNAQLVGQQQQKQEANLKSISNNQQQHRAQVILSTAFINQNPNANDGRPDAASQRRLQASMETGQQQHQQQPFKYHLNHLRPPSLVPITIQQQAHYFAGQATAAGENQEPGKPAPGFRELQVGESTNIQTRRQLLGPSEAEHQALQNWPLMMESLAPVQGGRESGRGARLIELQLPLQLHLKLRPLPLPMPPPPPSKGQAELAGPNRNSSASLSPVEPTTAGSISTGTAGLASDSSQSAPQENLRLPSVAGPKLATAEQRNLLALTWKEAKRILLLSAMSPNILTQQNKINRRAADLDQQELELRRRADEEGAGRTRRFSESPPISEQQQAARPTEPRGSESREKEPTVGEESRPSAASGDSTAPSWQFSTLAPTARPNQGETWRQRHSSQQQSEFQGQPLKPAETNHADSRIQAMAASMLPLLWPSFHLAASGPFNNQRLVAENQQQQVASSWLLPRDRQLNRQLLSEPGSQWPLQYIRLDRSGAWPATPAANSSGSEYQDHASQSSSISANHVEPTTTTAASTSPSSRQAESIASEAKQALIKRKRRRPTYLSPTSLLASSPYPDSTRMASKYPMPRIKFQARDNQLGGGAKQQVLAKTTLNGTIVQRKPSFSPTDFNSTGGQEVKLPIQVPKNLSKLIEQQLLLNATSILQQHKKSNKNGRGLRPTTSVSKIVRLKSDTNSSEPDRKPGQATRKEALDKGLSVSSKTSTMAPVEALTERISPLAAQSVENDSKFELNAAGSTTTTTTTTTTEAPITPTTATATTTTTTLPPKSEPFEAAGGSGRPIRRQVASHDSPQTESSALYKSAPAPESLAGGKEVEQIGDKKATELKFESTEPSVTASTAASISTKRPLRAGSGKKYGALLQAGQQPKKNVKSLFHFKRKPDMKKLPFYKKPLNYTELGWSEEQIREHMENTALLLQDNGLLMGALDNSGHGGPAQEQVPAAADEGSLLKSRKRRGGKNQFERLMAELHGDGGESGAKGSNLVATISPLDSRSQTREEPMPATTTFDSLPDLVPVLKKKNETLVLKPIFFVMDQKRRHQGGRPELERANGTSSTTTTTTTGSPIPLTSSSSTTETEPDQREAKSLNGSKPIIRMRRKHHGDQPPIVYFDQKPDSWRPSKSVWSQQLQSRNSANFDETAKVLLVPSGLLTPSGSQLIPLFKAPIQTGFELGASSSDEFTWRPTGPGSVKPSGGLAPSGEEGSLLAPTSGSHLMKQVESRPVALIASSASKPISKGEKRAQKPAQAGSKLPKSSEQTPSVSGESQLRTIPKLLSKPMRPAKYSLNGYIPKPSLSQQQMERSQPAAARGQQVATASGSGQNKDLDSSTSNEIFSRRRGLQQHQRSTAQAFDAPIGSLLEAGGRAFPPSSSAPFSSMQKQMEENKRKYVIQQQHQLMFNKSPTLSVQKVNQIKAKLGLTISSSDELMRKLAKTRKTSAAAATADGQAPTTNNIVTADPESAPTIPDLTQAAQVNANQLLIGAPLNSIPKTDFECTDKKGNFINGLFADFKTGCQVWHLCSNNRKYSFLCPAGTIFNAKVRICDWRYNVKCENSPLF